MTNEQMNVYKMRITQAGIGEMNVIMLEMEMQWIEEALEAYDRKDETTFVSCVDKAQAVQIELMNVTNVKNAVGFDVYSIYAFINKQLITAKIKRQPLEIERCKVMLEKLHKSFVEIAATDNGGPVMVGSEKVYAGLTYGTSGLVESSMGGTEYTV
ncbi:MAG: flagellar protein FliS [Lachnospiraceae bacterium]|nr:flagellar protein FliS [Lachnospiraceae bacterium]